MKSPIADPFVTLAPLEREETRVFQHSFWRVYFGTLLMAVIIGPVLLLCLRALDIPQTR